jgi:hypothetical protein
MAVDRREAMRFIKGVLKNGTPDWIRFPQHYKALADEWTREARQNLHEECYDYKVQDQDDLADPAGRRVNMMAAAVFMRKARSAGLTCFSHDSQLADRTASFFVLMPTARGGEFKPMCSIQVPLMWEWSLLRIDPQTNLATGFRDIGWRSAVRVMVEQGALTESKAHEVFGEPRISIVSSRYRRMLWEHRNRRSKHQNAA